MRSLFNDSLQSYSEFSSVFVSGEATETRRAERRCSWTREDRLLFLARPSLQRERERNLGSDDGGAGEPQGFTSEYQSITSRHDQ